MRDAGRSGPISRLFSLFYSEFTGNCNFSGESWPYEAMKTRRIPPFSEPNSLDQEQGISPVETGKQNVANREQLMVDQGVLVPSFLVHNQP